MKLILGLAMVAMLAAGGWWFTRSSETNPSIETGFDDVDKSESRIDDPSFDFKRARGVEEERSTVTNKTVEPASTVTVTVHTLLPRQRGKSRRGAPFIRVCLGLGSEPGLNKLTDGKTDSDGKVLLSIPASSGGGSFTLWAAVDEPGYQDRSQTKYISRNLDLEKQPPELQLFAYEGATIRGRVIGREGKPIRATVRLFQEFEGTWKSYHVDASRSGPFALHVPGSGLYRITAQETYGDNSVSPGTAALSPMNIDVDNPPQDLQLQLKGEGRLVGRVLDSDGQPAAALELLALTAEADDGEGSLVVRKEISSAYAFEGKGHYYDIAQSDSQGRFEFDGLRNDAFIVRAKTSEQRGYPFLLTTEPVLSDGEELILRMDRSYFAVRVVDADGQPVNVKYVGEGRGQEFERKWPEEPMVMVVAAAPFSQGADSWSLLQEGKRGSDAEIIYEPSPGAEYQVSLLQPYSKPQVRLIPLEALSGRVDIVFELAQDEPHGTLAVEVLSPAGEPVRDEVRVRVLDLESGIPLVERQTWWKSRWNPKPWPAEFQFPVGSYRLEVESVPFIDDQHGTLIIKRAFGHFECDITIHAHDRTEVRASLSRPSFIRLSLIEKANDSDRNSVGSNLTNAMVFEGLDSEATFLLIRKGRYPEQLLFARQAFDGTSAAGVHLLNSLTLGEQATSEALSPGEYTVVGTLPDGRTAKSDIMLRAGETLDVTLQFEEND